ncbi:MAG: enolase C-terminal domain-like protein [Patescibacteria group bacterium]|jgi:enolase
MDLKIQKVQAYQILNGKGFPTVEGVLTLSDGRSVHTAVDLDGHIGKYAAEYLYDQDPLYSGKGVQRSLKYLNELVFPKLLNVDPLRYSDVDNWLLKADPTENKEVLGANTTLLVSQLVYRAAAMVLGIPLYKLIAQAYSTYGQKIEVKRIPPPIFTLISGGKHGVETLNFQEFAIIPSTGLTYSKALQMAVELYHELEKVFAYRNITAGIGDDGGYIPNLSSNIDAFEIIKEAILKSGLRTGMDIFFAVDMAAENFYKMGKYYIADSINPYSTDQMVEYVTKLFKEYRLLVIEDAFSNEDVSGWSQLVKKFNDKAYVFGDDLLSSNKKRLERAIKEGLCTMANVKLSQRGTLKEALEFVALAKKNDMKIAVSKTSIGTNDDFIADFAVGIQADFIKFGAPARGERVSKYNRLSIIEKEIA